MKPVRYTWSTKTFSSEFTVSSQKGVFLVSLTITVLSSFENTPSFSLIYILLIIFRSKSCLTDFLLLAIELTVVSHSI